MICGQTFGQLSCEATSHLPLYPWVLKSVYQLFVIDRPQTVICEYIQTHKEANPCPRCPRALLRVVYVLSQAVKTLKHTDQKRVANTCRSSRHFGEHQEIFGLKLPKPHTYLVLCLSEKVPTTSMNLIGFHWMPPLKVKIKAFISEHNVSGRWKMLMLHCRVAKTTNFMSTSRPILFKWSASILLTSYGFYP